MQKENKSHSKRVRKLVLMITLVAVILSVSTYAWFIGMQAVNITDFDVEVKAADSLLLSLDGDNWSSDLTISADTIKDAGTAYTGNTNNWGKLIPMSSIGEMDSSISRMKLFEKSSFTATPGGYRLMASRVGNTGATEVDGYVVFDLFVKNFSGTDYIPDLEELDEEAIYLTTNSKAKVAAGGVANTGIENSVRVAFTQIGRVIGTEDTPASITGITCADDAATGVTGICRDAQIWEPNDNRHVAAAISWYNTSCLKRAVDGTNVTSVSSYTTDLCGSVVDYSYYPTYAVTKPIASTDNVDVYDGAEYNGYTATSTGVDKFLSPHETFTDTMKMLAGVQRPTFMTLAANSITKVRVYIYIEGQDVDNYDFAQIGKRISINFGFTKERFTEDDINYGGPSINPEAPFITLTGANPYVVTLGDTYTDPGATVTDAKDVTDDVSSSIADPTVVVDSSNVNMTKAGQYIVLYTAVDSDGNKTVKTRKVTVAAE